MIVRLFAAAAVVGVFGLAGCGDGGSAVETRDRSDATSDTALTAAGIPAQAGTTSPAAARPALTPNRSETVDAKTARLFARNGAAFGAKTARDYLDKVEAFTINPPRDADRIERPNGDVLLYQASTNTFAVVSRDGVPKTMFKPDDGATYWAEQKAAAPTFGRRRDASRSAE
ncbi:S-type pyocin family protein [Brevundimonas sp.]|uniref:S-type pyocin family protein n=1 Tax=Brevundimonas sp. TaxID=1871086 RepID=UPI003568DBA8